MMTTTTPTVGDMLDSGFLLVLCEGNEDAVELLRWCLLSTVAMMAGKKPPQPPFQGTPKFKDANDRLKALGIVKLNPAHGPRYYELSFADLNERFENWQARRGQS
jgi:hypothetical protein